MEEALVTLEMAKNLAAATLHLEVSGMHVDIKYTRLAVVELRGSCMEVSSLQP